MPQDLIHKERMSLLPFRASRNCPQARRTLYDLVKMGLVDFVSDLVANCKAPTDEHLLLQSRQICYAVHNATENNRYRGATWFRDLLFHGVEHDKFKEAEFASWDSADSINLQHPEERKLRDFVNSCKQLSIIPTDSQLQDNASRILSDLESSSSFPCDAALSWFKFLIMSSNGWLQGFRCREELPYLSDTVTESPRDSRVSQSTHDRMEGEFLLSQPELIILSGRHSTTESSQHKGSTETPSNSLHFDIDTFLSASNLNSKALNTQTPESSKAFDRRAFPLYPKTTQKIQSTDLTSLEPDSFQTYSFCDTNCYRRLTHELSRFVASCISVSNTAQHHPTDEEIQRQARWIIFDDDDPWNQTAADNPEWLSAFKRDIGLV